jgi:hypothetical protein
MKKWQVVLEGIDWDTDGENPADFGLPNDWATTIEAEDDDTEDEVADRAVDKASDTFGWCISGIESEMVTKINSHEKV